MGRYWNLKENALDLSLCRTRCGRVRDYKMMMMMMMKIDTWPIGESIMNIGNFLSLKYIHIRTVDAWVVG
jgi:hypothetical protein